MTHPGEHDPQTMPLSSIADVVGVSEMLAERLALFADNFHLDSLEAIAEVDPSLAGSYLEASSEWPLTWRLSGYCRDIAQTAMKGIERDTTNPFSVALLESGKYHADTLDHVYPNADSPRLAFATDIIKWVDAMKGKGRQLVVMLELGEDESSRVEYSIFEDVEIARTHLEDHTDVSQISPEDVENGYEPYRWVGSCVIVQGSTEEIDTLITTTQA